MSDGFVDSEEDMLNKVFDLKTKLDITLKNTVNIKYKLHAYDNKDHIKSINVVVESKQYCVRS